jgi:hypothetical protein
MKELSVEQKAKRYDEAKYIMKEYLESGNAGVIAENTIKKAFPELEESEDERIRKDIVTYLKSILSNKKYGDKFIEDWIAWLAKQQKPNYCHHEVDLSGCSEEYRKAYYDGWNNCNQQHAQLAAEQKTAWSEEDEYHKRQILRILKDNGCSQTLQKKTEKWIEEKLKSIRPQSHWKPSEQQLKTL